MSMPFIAELSRRNVFKVAFVYVVGGALLYWLAGVAQTQLELPWWFNRLVGILFVIGLVATYVPIPILNPLAFHLIIASAVLMLLIAITIWPRRLINPVTM